MKRLGSLRFDGALAQVQRDEIVRVLSSAGVEVASWTQARSARRTYASLRLPPGDSVAEEVRSLIAGLSLVAARFDEPSMLALEITPRDPSRLPALRHALAGPGRLAGTLDAESTQDTESTQDAESTRDAKSTPKAESNDRALILELAPRASLRLVLDTIDAELAASPGRTVVPLLPLSDQTLTAFAAATLGLDGLDPRRLIETFSEPLLARGSA